MLNYQVLSKKEGKALKCFIFVLFLALFFSLLILPVNSAKAQTDLLVDGSFEGVIGDNWSLWKNDSSVRAYELYRAYDAPFGNGSYAAAIDARGNPEDLWRAGLVSKNKFAVSNGAKYLLIFYTKASSDLKVGVFLENAATYEAITPIIEKTVAGEWAKHTVTFSPNYTGDGLISFIYGSMPADSTLFLDGLRLTELNLAVQTAEVKGSIGEKNKFIGISNISTFKSEEIGVELPFYDSATGEITVKKFNPDSVTASGINITMPIRTFSGIGKIYIGNEFIGQFNYSVMPNITAIYPSLARASQDLTVAGSGFSPRDGTFLVVKIINQEKKIFESWVKPINFDSSLSQMTFTMPASLVSGSMYIHTSFFYSGDADTINRSNSFSYQVKPVITSVKWSYRGYDQVGDKLRIYGDGITNSPSVNFYNEAGKKIETKSAAVIETFAGEIIEVPASAKQNKFNITVSAGGVESDTINPLTYTAKPKLTSLTSKYSRSISGDGTKIQAGRLGDEIILKGDALKSSAAATFVEFQGLAGRIRIEIDSSKIDANGKWLKANIPQGAQNGYVSAEVNGAKSNSLSLEIVPTIVSIAPSPIMPGQNMAIIASGAGGNINLMKIYFSAGDGELLASPTAISFSGNETVIQVRAPLAISSDSTVVNIQYDKWRDNGKAVLSANPRITEASINMDTKILTIRGYGFSTNASKNKIIYKYADENRTVINPRVRGQGVFATEEGQEIRIKILDNYHYGYVAVKVGEAVSNEVNFGPVSISKISRRVEFVKSVGRVMGVLYINGYNFGPTGGVKVGANWAAVHYRTDNFIIAVIDQQFLYDNPVIVAK